MQTKTKTKTKTPCIGVCSTGIGDSVCRGCKRFAHEVIRWNGYLESERKAITNRLEALLSQVVSDRLQVIDVELLRQQLSNHQVSTSTTTNHYCLAYEAVRVFGAQLASLELIGCQATPPWRSRSVAELKRAIDEGFYELSCAHYERYFPGHM